MEQSANGFKGPVADSWTILQPAKDRNVHSELLCTLCSEKTPTHIFFHISMNYSWI